MPKSSPVIWTLQIRRLKNNELLHDVSTQVTDRGPGPSLDFKVALIEDRFLFWTKINLTFGQNIDHQAYDLQAKKPIHSLLETNEPLLESTTVSISVNGKYACYIDRIGDIIIVELESKKLRNRLRFNSSLVGRGPEEVGRETCFFSPELKAVMYSATEFTEMIQLAE